MAASIRSRRDKSKAASRRDGTQEAYPQAGDGYIWEPALQVVHADGNTSTDLHFEGVERTNDGAGQEYMRIQLGDPEYPFAVALCFRAHHDQDLIEQWTEIRHQETGAVTVERMDSTALLLPTNIYLTHFFGDWEKEMHPVTELLTPGTKILDSKIGVRRASIWQSLFYSLARRAAQRDVGARPRRFPGMVRQFPMRLR